MALKQQRRTLLFAGAVLLALSTVLAFTAVRASASPEVVPLGRGVAGVDETLSASALAGEEDLGEGEASYYGNQLAGRPTASGETFNPSAMTAAHRSLPLGSRVRVTHVGTGDQVTVRINDRGPFHARRVIDLSEAAARRLGMLQSGTARVRLALIL